MSQRDVYSRIVNEAKTTQDSAAKKEKILIIIIIIIIKYAAY